MADLKVEAATQALSHFVPRGKRWLEANGCCGTRSRGVPRQRQFCPKPRLPWRRWTGAETKTAHSQSCRAHPDRGPRQEAAQGNQHRRDELVQRITGGSRAPRSGTGQCARRYRSDAGADGAPRRACAGRRHGPASARCRCGADHHDPCAWWCRGRDAGWLAARGWRAGARCGPIGARAARPRGTIDPSGSPGRSWRGRGQGRGRFADGARPLGSARS
jgi:hypothetical protein